VLVTMALSAAVLVFVAGALSGATWVEQVHDGRSRRQAARQRQLNDQARYLRTQWDFLNEINN